MRTFTRVSIMLAWVVMLPWLLASLAAILTWAMWGHWVTDVYIHDVYFVLPNPFAALMAGCLTACLALATKKCFRPGATLPS